MKIAIGRIKIMERIRKKIENVPELAQDIRKNGLLQPVTVMPLDNGEYQLLAGLRRIKAAQSLGWTEIECNAVAPADAGTALYIEISENEQRQQFTFSERVDYARLIEETERAKAKGRKTEGQSLGGMTAGKGRSKNDSLVPHGTPSYQNESEAKQKTRDIVGEKIGMSGTQYERAKYIAANAPPEVIAQLDKGERTIRETYDELRAKEKTAPPPPDNSPAPKPPKRPRAPTEAERMKYLGEKDIEADRRLREFDALPPEGKIGELQRQLKAERARAATAESELALSRERHSSDVGHKDSIIESLKRQNAELTAALAAANAKITKLEGGGKT